MAVGSSPLLSKQQYGDPLILGYENDLDVSVSAKIFISCVLCATKFHSTQSWQLQKTIFHIEGCLESCANDYKFITFSALKTLHFQLHLSPLCGSHKTNPHY